MTGRKHVFSKTFKSTIQWISGFHTGHSTNVIWIILKCQNIDFQWMEYTPKSTTPNERFQLHVFGCVCNISPSPLLWRDKSIHQSNPSNFAWISEKSMLWKTILMVYQISGVYSWEIRPTNSEFQFKEGCPPQQEKNVQREFVISANEIRNPKSHVFSTILGGWTHPLWRSHLFG